MKILFEITDEYSSKYKLDPSFINKKIVMFDDRIQHIERHAKEFKNNGSYTNAILNIDSILSSPDFICKDEKNNSLEFVKKLEDNILIAVRVSNSEYLKLKTLYPINNIKYNKLKAKASKLGQL